MLRCSTPRYREPSVRMTHNQWRSSGAPLSSGIFHMCAFIGERFTLGCARENDANGDTFLLCVVHLYPLAAYKNVLVSRYVPSYLSMHP